MRKITLAVFVLFAVLAANALAVSIESVVIGDDTKIQLVSPSASVPVKIRLGELQGAPAYVILYAVGPDGNTTNVSEAIMRAGETRATLYIKFGSGFDGKKVKVLVEALTFPVLSGFKGELGFGAGEPEITRRFWYYSAQFDKGILVVSSKYRSLKEAEAGSDYTNPLEVIALSDEVQAIEKGFSKNPLKVYDFDGFEAYVKKEVDLVVKKIDGAKYLSDEERTLFRSKAPKAREDSLRAVFSHDLAEEYLRMEAADLQLTNRICSGSGEPIFGAIFGCDANRLGYKYWAAETKFALNEVTSLEEGLPDFSTLEERFQKTLPNSKDPDMLTLFILIAGGKPPSVLKTKEPLLSTLAELQQRDEASGRYYIKFTKQDHTALMARKARFFDGLGGYEQVASTRVQLCRNAIETLYPLEAKGWSLDASGKMVWSGKYACKTHSAELSSDVSWCCSNAFTSYGETQLSAAFQAANGMTNIPGIPILVGAALVPPLATAIGAFVLHDMSSKVVTDFNKGGAASVKLVDVVMLGAALSGTGLKTVSELEATPLGAALKEPLQRVYSNVKQEAIPKIRGKIEAIAETVGRTIREETTAAPQSALGEAANGVFEQFLVEELGQIDLAAKLPSTKITRVVSNAEKAKALSSPRITRVVNDGESAVANLDAGVSRGTPNLKSGNSQLKRAAELISEITRQVVEAARKQVEAFLKTDSSFKKFASSFEAATGEKLQSVGELRYLGRGFFKEAFEADYVTASGRKGTAVFSLVRGEEVPVYVQQAEWRGLKKFDEMGIGPKVLTKEPLETAEGKVLFATEKISQQDIPSFEMADAVHKYPDTVNLYSDSISSDSFFRGRLAAKEWDKGGAVGDPHPSNRILVKDKNVIDYKYIDAGGYAEGLSPWEQLMITENAGPIYNFVEITDSEAFLTGMRSVWGEEKTAQFLGRALAGLQKEVVSKFTAESPKNVWILHDSTGCTSCHQIVELSNSQFNILNSAVKKKLPLSEVFETKEFSDVKLTYNGRLDFPATITPLVKEGDLVKSAKNLIGFITKFCKVAGLKCG